MVSTSGCAMADEVDLVGNLSPVIGVGDEEDTVAELVEWPRLKGSRVEYPTGSSRFREFCKAKSSIDGVWGHAFGYRGNFFRTCCISQGGNYLHLLPDLAKEKKCRRLGDEVSLEYVQGVVKDSQTDSFCYYLAQFDYGLTLPLSNLAKSVMNMIGACPVQLNCNFWEVTLVCGTLNERWAVSGSERRITAKDFLEYYVVKYVTATDGAYLFSSSSRLCFFDLSSAGRVWNDNLLWVSGECLQRSDEEPLELNSRTITKGISCKVLRKESFIDAVAREGTELEAILKELEISRFKRVASKDDKFPRLNKMPDGPVNMATVSSTVVRNLAKRKTVVLEESDKIAEGADLGPHFEAKANLLEEQCRPKSREKMVAIVDDEFKKFARALRGDQLGLQDSFSVGAGEKREAAALKLKEIRAESVAEVERLVTASATSRNNLAGKLYKVRYTKVDILAFSEVNYEEKEIMDEEEVEEMEDGLNVVEKTAADNQETIDQELDVAREREERTFLYNAKYAEEYESLISQYEDWLDDNVKLALKLEEAKSQFEDMTITILSSDLALNQLTNELAELKEKAASGSRHEAELGEYRIRALNDEISDMKYNIHALNKQLLKNEIDLNTARTNLAMSEADFEKLNNSIAGKDLELRNSAQIRDSLITRLDRLKADLRCLKGREAQSRADLAEVQAKNKILVNDLAHAHGNVRRVMKSDKEMNERINQLCAQISKLEQELRVRELKY
ncbi:hypothetical protein GIB67_016437 [Kingdonia uniflora]|uniref:Uncharacterized protein n=1 Tax=Kingdonia uniflora TaxID=39325 RepID=A0A7J7MGY8_9MAGN|nr:hypothetical protein GIB67_016437 [Kingdonia uniflora]